MLTRKLLLHQKKMNNIPIFNVSIALIKQLRAQTGSPINECKKALEAHDSDIDRATQYLKERGLLYAEKKLSNETKEGVIGALTNDKYNLAIMAEINCETDFVARTSEFLSFSNNLLKFGLSIGNEMNLEDKYDIEQLLKQPIKSDFFQTPTIDETQKLLISKLQENIVVSRFRIFEALPHSVFGIYLHNCYGSYPCGMVGCVFEIGAKVELNEPQRKILSEGAQNLAITYLGMKPKYIQRSDVPESILEEEKEKIKANLPESKKKAGQKTIDLIVQGKLKKFYEDNIFLEMDYILNDEEEWTIGDYIRVLEKDIGVDKDSLSIQRHVSVSVK